MKSVICCLAAVILNWVAVIPSTAAKDLKELSVLYIGSERSSEFVPFLKRNFSRVETRSRQDFKIPDAAAFDVVLLDWPQTGQPSDFPPKLSPLGKREEWTKPTVLLGSAGKANKPYALSFDYFASDFFPRRHQNLGP